MKTTKHWKLFLLTFFIMLVIIILGLTAQIPAPPTNLNVTLNNSLLDDNAYCTPQGTWIGPSMDGPARMPVNCMNTAMSNTPSPGTVHGPFTTFSALQAAVNAGACGDGYSVLAGTDLGLHTLVLPQKNCDNKHWNWIYTTALSDPRFPAEGVRMTPCWAGKSSLLNRSYPCPVSANLLFRLEAARSSSAMNSPNGDHWRIIGADLSRDPTGGIAIYNFVDLSGTPSNIIFDRIWFEGIENTFPITVQSADTSTTRAIYLGQSNHIAVIDSYFTNFYDTSAMSANGNTDAQCVGGGVGTTPNSGWGVYKFVNNHCEASGEGILLGGSAGPPLTPTGCTIMVNCNLDVPVDIEVRRNYFFKPPQWNGNTTVPAGTGWPVIKNGFEMKIGARALFEGNVIENTWYQAQVGWCWSTAPKNQSNNAGTLPTAPTALTNDFTYRHNYCYGASYGFGLYQSMDSGCTQCQAQGANGISEHDNVIGDALSLGNLTAQSSGDAWSITAASDNTGLGLNQLNNVLIQHNTFVRAIRYGIGFGASSTGQLHNWKIIDNVFVYGTYGVGSNPSLSGCSTTNSFFQILNNCLGTTWTVSNNVMFNWPTNIALGNTWPTDGKGAGNFFENGSSTIGFTNYGTGDSSFNPGNYALTSSSKYAGKGTDGKDLGADIPALVQLISGVRE